MTSPHSSNTPASSRRAGALRRAARNPVVVACALAFVAAVGFVWLLTETTSRREAKALLRAAAADMRKTVSACADNLLFYQGNAIVNHYRRPEAMTVDTVQQLMARYGLDELNVVDRNGVVLAGALADVGYDMGSHPQTAKFNCLLAGAKTYSQDFRAPVEDPNGEKRKYAGVAFPWPVKGYIQMGFSERRLHHGIDFWFEDAAIDWHIGDRGYFIIADEETGVVKSCGREDPSGSATIRRGVTLRQIGFDISAVPTDATKCFSITLFGEKSLCLTEVRCFHRIICVIPFSEIESEGIRALVVSGTVLLVIFLMVLSFMTRLTDLVASLRQKEREERERQLRDLTLAKTIQTSSLPMTMLAASDYVVTARMDTAREVGGDFYDYYALPSGKTLVLIADVSGKGVPAALFMMRARAMIRTVLQEGGALEDRVAEANARLAQNNSGEMFVTAWIGLYDRSTGTVEYVSAGHNPPLVRRADGTVEWVRGRSGPVLAAIEGARYRVHRIDLRPGDALVLYTDGVTEAMDATGGLYGESRLAAALAHAQGDYIVAIVDDLRRFVAGAEQSDDITMLVLDVRREGDAE